jgi:hypothetical protein
VARCKFQDYPVDFGPELLHQVADRRILVMDCVLDRQFDLNTFLHAVGGSTGHIFALPRLAPAQTCRGLIINVIRFWSRKYWSTFMKVGELVLLLTLAAVPAAGEPIRAGDAIVHLGETTTVEGRASIDMMRSGEIYIDLDGGGSKSLFSGYISRWNVAKFGDIDHLSGRNIDITGPIDTFRGRPEIFLTDPSQIRVK